MICDGEIWKSSRGRITIRADRSHSSSTMLRGNDLLNAITREVNPNIGQCEITHILQGDIDVDLARTQQCKQEKLYCCFV